MNVIALLFLVGLVLFVFEVITPGGVLGVLGGLAMLGGCVVAFQSYGAGGGTAATAVALALVGLTVYVEFVLLAKTRYGKKFFLHKAVDATSQPALADRDVVGKSCEAETTLAPSGYVLLDGRRFEAYCRSGHVVKGTKLQVVGLDNFRLIVTKYQT
jgi:membrane-bound serine protease (ClpP class)